ncbi:MAG: hypothetical protein HYZ89_06280 [Candidatus Omnitrophica bacterium]|nr:hypothetical protein [Candidatus Omnitrophota bacterium]
MVSPVMASLYWRGRIAWIKYQRHGRSIRSSLRTTDPKIATYLLNKKEAELAEGRSPLPPQRVELRGCMEEFLHDTAIRKKPTTLRKDRLHLMDFARWARVSSVHQITEPVIHDYLTHLIQDRHLSPFTANGTTPTSTRSGTLRGTMKPLAD